MWDVLRAIGIQSAVNIVVDKNFEGSITVYLGKVTSEQGLKKLLEANGFLRRKKRIIFL